MDHSAFQPLAAAAGHVVAYTDGACSPNPGNGGWGTVLLAGEHRLELSGHERDSTNNRMELRACVAALDAMPVACSGRVFTDSSYVRLGITKWVKGWRAKAWTTKARKPVKNVDLWELLDALNRERRVEWFWVKGHSNHIHNDRADFLARQARIHLRDLRSP